MTRALIDAYNEWEAARKEAEAMPCPSLRLTRAEKAVRALLAGLKEDASRPIGSRLVPLRRDR